jgi:CheY-like chemotaxis protein
MTNDFLVETHRPAAEQDGYEGAAIGFSIFAAAPRVLHIDSDGDTALVLATLLVPETQVTHVPTLQDALHALHTEQFALVVMDPNLPDGDGADLYAVMHQTQRDARVLLYSARQPDQRDLASAFLPKPWTSPRQLWRSVSELLSIGQMMPAEPQ